MFFGINFLKRQFGIYCFQHLLRVVEVMICENGKKQARGASEKKLV